jgi:hypothetical protein
MTQNKRTLKPKFKQIRDHFSYSIDRYHARELARREAIHKLLEEQREDYQALITATFDLIKLAGHIEDYALDEKDDLSEREFHQTNYVLTTFFEKIRSGKYE